MELRIGTLTQLDLPSTLSRLTFGLRNMITSSHLSLSPSLVRFGPTTSESQADCLVLALLLCAQALRSLAMIHASVSFSHVVKAVKHDDHTLITHGVYS